MTGAPNIYAYVLNDPINLIDEDGLRGVRPPMRPPQQGFRERFQPAPFRTMNQQQTLRGLQRYERMTMLREEFDRTLQEFPSLEEIMSVADLEAIRQQLPQSPIDALNSAFDGYANTQRSCERLPVRSGLPELKPY